MLFSPLSLSRNDEMFLISKSSRGEIKRNIKIFIDLIVFREVQKWKRFFFPAGGIFILYCCQYAIDLLAFICSSYCSMLFTKQIKCPFST